MNAKYILSRLRTENGADVAAEVKHDVAIDKAIDGSVLELTRCTDDSSPLKPYQRTVVIEISPAVDPIEITLFEDAVGATASGTGATLWDCSIVLTKYLLSECHCMDKKVVELGAGLALPSIALAMQGAEVVATERDITCGILKMNIDANRRHITNGNIEVHGLSWSSDETELQEYCRAFECCDVIIGSDLIFPRNEDAWLALVCTYRHLLRRGRLPSSKSKIGYLAYENRSDHVIAAFTTLLLEYGVRCERCPVPATLDCPPDIAIFRLCLLGDSADLDTHMR